MTTQSKLDKLRSSAFLKEFPPEYFDQLVAFGREIEIPARTTVFKEFDRAKDVYVILSGEIILAIDENDDSRGNWNPSPRRFNGLVATRGATSTLRHGSNGD